MPGYCIFILFPVNSPVLESQKAKKTRITRECALKDSGIRLAVMIANQAIGKFFPIFMGKIDQHHISALKTSWRIISNKTSD